MSAAATIRIQEADFDVGHEIAALTRGRTDVGAVVSFSGICRGSENGDADRGADARTLSRHGGSRNQTPCRRGDVALAADRA